MPYWGWIIMGLCLLGVELGAVDAAFYLVFIGVSAIAVGMLVGTGVELAPWIQWLLFGATSLISMALFRKQLYLKLRGNIVGYDDKAIGGVVRCHEKIEPEESGRVLYQGVDWSGINVGDSVIEEGAMAQIIERDGISFLIKNIDQQQKG